MLRPNELSPSFLPLVLVTKFYLVMPVRQAPLGVVWFLHFLVQGLCPAPRLGVPPVMARCGGGTRRSRRQSRQDPMPRRSLGTREIEYPQQ